MPCHRHIGRTGGSDLGHIAQVKFFFIGDVSPVSPGPFKQKRIQPGYARIFFYVGFWDPRFCGRKLLLYIGGGAIYATGASTKVTVTQCTFEKNTADVSLLLHFSACIF